MRCAETTLISCATPSAVERLGGVAHRLPVGAAAHDDPDQRLRHHCPVSTQFAKSAVSFRNMDGRGAIALGRWPAFSRTRDSSYAAGDRGNSGATWMTACIDMTDPERLLAEIGAAARARSRSSQRARRAARPAGPPGRADRPAQPPRLHAPARRLIARVKRYDDTRGDAVRRHRRPEDDQRHVRPPGRRRGADPGRARCWSAASAGATAWRGIGGDEFGILLEHADEASAQRDRGAAGRP